MIARASIAEWAVLSFGTPLNVAEAQAARYLPLHAMTTTMESPASVNGGVHVVSSLSSSSS